MIVSQHPVYLCVIVSDHPVYLSMIVSDHPVYLSKIGSDHPLYLSMIVTASKFSVVAPCMGSSMVLNRTILYSNDLLH